MNKRIEELAEQSIEEKLTMDEFIEALKKEPHDFYGFRRRELEKFAELIIQDFLSICESERDGYVKLRRSAVEFEDKNIFAEGETACDLIRVMTKRHFRS